MEKKRAVLDILGTGLSLLERVQAMFSEGDQRIGVAATLPKEILELVLEGALKIKKNPTHIRRGRGHKHRKRFNGARRHARLKAKQRRRRARAA